MEMHNPVGDAVPGAIPETARLLMSRNEIVALCFKAARGAGMSWGLAEEAGQAAAWLAQRGLDGPRSLAAHLMTAEGKSWQEICPEVRAGQWNTRAATPMCPIAFGATFCDFATLPEAVLTPGGLSTSPVSQPLLVLPFLSSAAQTLGSDLRVSWTGGQASLGRDGKIYGSAAALGDIASERLRIEICEEMTGVEFEAGMAPVGSQTLERLNVFAMKTTVPPSDQSRAGAGAGTSDND